MYQRIIVPIDGSQLSWRALGPARALSAVFDAPVELFEAVEYEADVPVSEKNLRARLEDLVGEGADDVTVTVEATRDLPALAIAGHAESISGGLVVMSSIGRGRSAAVLGSVTEAVIAELFGPVVVVGPHAELTPTALAGPIVVPVDGSETSETALSLAASWGIVLRARPWIVTVADPDVQISADIVETAYPARLARQLTDQSHHRVEYEVLHDRHPARGVVTFAEDIGASMIVASTHGRTGLARIRVGSVAMDMVRHATCPVVLNRPPHIR